MIEAFTAFGVGRCFVFREFPGDLTCNESRIDHDILGFARVNIHAFYDKISTCGIEVFVCNFTFIITVNGVCKICFKIIQIKKVCAGANFLIRCDSNPDIAVRGSFQDQLFHSGKNLGNTGFVVSTEQCCAVCGDQSSSF